MSKCSRRLHQRSARAILADQIFSMTDTTKSCAEVKVARKEVSETFRRLHIKAVSGVVEN